MLAYCLSAKFNFLTAAADYEVSDITVSLNTLPRTVPAPHDNVTLPQIKLY